MSDETDTGGGTEGRDRQVGFLVHGRVQGVGFRWWACRTARSLGLAGTVRNRVDGTVEVRARGSRTALADLEKRLHEGPRPAAVRRVETFAVYGLEGTDFIIEP